MALKNLFDMVKADRYTADGREELIKAQEAETEDKVYQIGEISQKTGLQKTANGWVKPKSGKQPGAKKPDESARIAASKEARAKKSQELGQKAAGDFAKYKDLPPVQRKDALGAASHEGISIGMTQRSMEGMGWDLIQADDKVNVYGKPDGSKAIMKHDGKKITEVSYEAPGNKPAAQEEIGKFYTKFKDAQSAYDAGRQTFPEGGYKIYNTPQGYKVVDDPKTQQRMEAAGYEVEVDVPEGTKPPKSPAEKKPAAEKPERFDYRSSLEKNPRDAFSFKGTVTHSIPTNQYHYDELQNLASFMREEKATYQNALKSRAQALVDGHRSNGDWEPKKEQALMDIAKAVGFDDELHTFIAEENRGYDLGYSEDSAPRVLTGDTRIRVRKA